MKTALYLIKKNPWIARLLVGALVVTFLYQGVIGQDQKDIPIHRQILATAKAVPVRPDISLKHVVDKDPSKELIRLAKTDHIALLKFTIEHYQKNIRDYTTNFEKQERINGKLKKQQQMSILFKDQPYSLLMKWEENPDSIDKLLYVEGKNDNKMIVHPTGLFSWIKSVKRDPRCKDARKSSRRTCDQFGFFRSMQDMLAAYELAQKNKDLKMNYLGINTINERKCVTIERLLPAKKEYSCHRLVVSFDLEYLLPVAIASYDWQNNLLSSYEYNNLKFNVGLASRTFTPKVNRL